MFLFHHRRLRFTFKHFFPLLFSFFSKFYALVSLFYNIFLSLSALPAPFVLPSYLKPFPPFLNCLYPFLSAFLTPIHPSLFPLLSIFIPFPSLFFIPIYAFVSHLLFLPFPIFFPFMHLSLISSPFLPSPLGISIPSYKCSPPLLFFLSLFPPLFLFPPFIYPLNVTCRLPQVYHR